MYGPRVAHTRSKSAKDRVEHVINAVDGDKCTCKLKILSQPYRGLLDTGATVSLISDRLLKSKRICILPPDITLKTVSGEKLKVVGKVQLKVTIGSTVTAHWFHVVRGITNNVILGFDFISNNNIQLNFDKTNGNTMRIGRSTVPLTNAEFIRSLVRLKEDVILPPQSAIITQGICKKIQRTHNEQITGTVCQIESGFIAREPGLVVTNGLVSMNDHKIIPLTIANYTGKFIKMRKGNVVALFQKINSEHEVATLQQFIDRAHCESLNPHANDNPKLNAILNANKDVFTQGEMDLGKTKLVEMTIDTGDHEPIKSKPYRIPYNQKRVIDEQIDKMLQAKVIQPIKSPWSFPVVIVKKKDGTERFCVDYRKLNKITVRNNWPLPNIDDMLATLGENKIFSSIDISSAYWQVEVSEKDKEKTAFVCHRGLFAFNVMPFGLAGSPAIFSELMTKILGDLDFAMAYLDDVIIFSKTEEEHYKHIEVVLDLIRQAGLKLKMKKCQFFQDKISYLGHVVTKDGVLPDKDKVSAIMGMKQPTNVKEVRGFIGVTNFYRKFIPNYSQIASPLLDLTHKFAHFNWSRECEEAFQKLKHALCHPPLLAYPDMKRPFIVSCDASDKAIGAVLSQDFGEGERPIQYMSQRLSKSQRNWPVVQREAFAIYTAMEKFHQYLYGSEFTIKTDHKPLEYLFSSEIKNPMIQRWAMKVSELKPHILYIKGQSNFSADFLSRLTPQSSRAEMSEQNEEVKLINTDEIDPKLIRLMRKEAEERRLQRLQESPQVEIDNIQTMQKEDSDIQNILKALNNNEKAVSKKYILKDDILYFVGVDSDRLRLVVPEKLQAVVLHHCHDNQGHIGAEKMYELIKADYYWSGLYRDVLNYVETCVPCQTRTVKKTKVPLQTPEFVGWPGEKVAVDVCGPYPVSAQNNKYLVTFIDMYSGYPEAFAVADKSAQTIAKLLLEEYISRYSCPLTLLSDNGTEFVNEVIEQVCAKLKINHIRSSPYHPEGNAKIERMHRVLNDIISKQLDKNPECWESCIPHALAAIRTSPSTSTKFSPFFLFFGRDPCLPINTLLAPHRKYQGEMYHQICLQQQHNAFKTVQKHLKRSRERMEHQYNKNAREKIFQVGDPVYLQNSNDNSKWRKRWVPYYRILAQNGPVNYTIQNQITGSIHKVHANLLLPSSVQWRIDKSAPMPHRKSYYVCPSDSESSASTSESEGSELDDNIPLARLREQMRNDGIAENNVSHPLTQLSETSAANKQMTNPDMIHEEMDTAGNCITLKRQRSVDNDDDHTQMLSKKTKVKELLKIISDII